MIGFIPLLLVVLQAISTAANPMYTATPQMGWNSWNKFACNISESLIKETADALVSTGLASLGYNYINLDDCWQASLRGKDGSIQADSTRFPSGLKALGDYIHSKGLKFGIYSSAGFKTCQAFPASLGLEDVDASLYKDWGVDYLKYDNCFEDHGLPQHRYGAMAEALQSTGRDIFYSLCEWGRENPAAWASNIGAQSWRISGDIRDDWQSFISRAEIAASLWRYSGPGRGWNDPDMLEIGNGHCTEVEYRTHMSLWAMLKAPMIIGNDIRNMDASTLSILNNKEVLAINQDPLGQQGRIVFSDSSELLSKLGYGDKLIATLCAAKANRGGTDDPLDQAWSIQEDGTIRSESTGHCLHEMDSLFRGIEGSDHFNFTLGVRSVTTKSDCSAATRWEVGLSSAGGEVVSKSSGLCLEVEKLEVLPITQGKRVQTAPCQGMAKNSFDVREHQSWTTPKGTLLNLYQRSCLTLDRDAFPGIVEELWLAPLSGNDYAVLLINKGPTNLPKAVISLERLGLPLTKKYRMRDLWTKQDLDSTLSAIKPASFDLQSHDSILLRLSEI